MTSMFGSGYVPGGITSLLQTNTTKKKKAKKEDDGDAEKKNALSQLFSTPLPPTPVFKAFEKPNQKRKINEEAADEKHVKGSKKRKLSEADVDEDSAKASTRKKKSDYTGDVETRKRTVFVGNVPLNSNKKDVKKLFTEFGAIESVRFRSATPADAKTPKKKAVIKGVFHPKRSSMNAYVLFKEPEHAQAALKMNGHEFNEHHIRVDLAFSDKQHDHSRCVFVGNLPYNAENEALRLHFESAGQVEDVRIVRDRASGMGKGFGYIRFVDRTSVDFALTLDGQPYNGGRKLRVTIAKKESDIQTEQQTSKTTTTTKTAPTAQPKKKREGKKMRWRDRDSSMVSGDSTPKKPVVSVVSEPKKKKVLVSDNSVPKKANVSDDSAPKKKKVVVSDDSAPKKKKKKAVLSDDSTPKKKKKEKVLGDSTPKKEAATSEDATSSAPKKELTKQEIRSLKKKRQKTKKRMLKKSLAVKKKKNIAAKLLTGDGQNKKVKQISNE